MGDANPSLATTSLHHSEMFQLFCAWAMGSIIAKNCEPDWLMVFIILAVAIYLIMILAWMRRRSKIVTMTLALLAVVFSSASWWSLREHRFEQTHISQHIQLENQLVDLEGLVTAPPFVQYQPTGTMGRFTYSKPNTRFVMRVEQWHGNGHSIKVTGKITVKIPGIDKRIKAGDRVRCQGWISEIGKPANPGERDRNYMLGKQGIVGQLFLKSPGNWQLLQKQSGFYGKWLALRSHWSDAARHALRVDLADDSNTKRMGMLEAILLGQRGKSSQQLDLAFRRTGQAHLLSISGLHVGIIALGAWLLGQLIFRRPNIAAITALVAIGVYMMIIPVRIPLIRAGLMTSVFCIAYARGKRISGINLLAAVALGLLIWRPWDLFEPGFQLSFGIVAGLILFTAPLAARLFPRSLYLEHASIGMFRKFGMDYIAVSLVAFLTAMPLVIYHFGIVSPYAVFMAIIMLPLVMAMLWLGFLKIMISLIWPWLGSMIGVLLNGVGWVVENMVTHVADLPGVWFNVPKPSPAWVIMAMVFVVALLSGQFIRRRLHLFFSLLLITGWLMWPQLAARSPLQLPGKPVMQLHMISVGNGSCYVICSNEQTWMFDCGSASYANVGTNSVVPALRSLGITKINTLIISHADLDHFNGTIDLADNMTIGRVITTKYVIEQAKKKPWSATGFLITQLNKRNIKIETVMRHWTDSFSHVQVQAIWPPADMRFDEDNDNSLVFSFLCQNKRLLMCGDIQQDAMTAMFERQLDLKADVTDLPHHGSFVKASPSWLKAVDPEIILQSTGRRRLQNDKWATHLDGNKRYTTPWHGMTTINIYSNCEMKIVTLKNDKP